MLAGQEVLDLLDVRDRDRAACAAMLEAPPGDAVAAAMSALRGRLGTFPARPAPDGGATELEWIEAILRFAPETHQHHLQSGIPAADSRAILADVGLNLDINRRVHGRFGLDTWPWLTLHLAGNMFRLGRLQFHLVPRPSTVPGPAVEGGGWNLGIHIPEDGGLAPSSVDASLRLAVEFFARHFPDKPVLAATCDSWMLDPYLSERLPSSNIAAFASRFTVDRCTDAPTDAVYFTFRQRGMENLDRLPRETSLQRVVLERIDDGGTWQLGHGRMAWPPLG